MFAPGPQVPLLTIAALLVLGSSAVAAEPGKGQGSTKVDFARQVRPILAENCFECHGPDPRGRKGKLRLDRRDGLVADRGGYAVLVPDRPEESELIVRITSDSADEQMPPPDSRRSLTKEQIELLRRWVAEGAAWSEHWAFVPPVRPVLPAVSNPAWCFTPIDRFILARFDAAGLTPAPAADRGTLLRRLSLDLLGLPPTPEDIARFQADDRPGAYERLVDRLLASPHFGERWGRHWLDLVRYADSDGYEDDFARPDAWRFRDWVIAAFNGDMPFDQFTIEQLAGDLLPGSGSGSGYDQRVAAGYFRMALFNRSAVGRDNEEEFRTKLVKDRAGTTATIWLGLTFGCAECHTHKYDPLPQRDYYRFYAFFNSLVDVEIDAPALSPEHFRAYERQAAEFDRAQARAKAALQVYEFDELPQRQAAWEASALKEPDPAELPGAIAAILAVAPDRRSGGQADLLADYFRSIDAEYLRLKANVLDGEMAKNNRPLPPSTKALTVAERPEPRATYLQVRGDYLSPGEPVQPGTPAFLPPMRPQPRPAGDAMPDRFDLARWLVDPANPLTSRVAANAVWQALFGRGLVATPENFGLQGEPPSHPELLDWLAAELVSSGWSRKHLIRLIVTSRTYRQSSQARPELAEVDPGNRLLARQNRFRVEAEIVRDLALAVAGLLNRELGGPSVQPPLPDSLLARPELKSERLMPPSRGAGRYRRGVYVNVQRTFAYPMLTEFDGADASAACTRRERSNTPQQALTLLNDPVFAECARALGLRLVREGPSARDDRIVHAVRLCLARTPNPREAAILGQVYDQHRALYAADPASVARLLGTEPLPLPAGVSPPEAAAWVAVARTLLNLDEFLTRE
jgi:hypothetical protein